MKHRVTMISVLSLLAVSVACGWVGFYELFANFREYDDEGCMMVSNLLFLNGHIPYEEVPSLYGPVWLAIVQLLHDWLRVPVNSSAVRFVTLAEWLLLSGVAGLLVAKLTSSRIWMLASFILAFLFVQSIVNEPGHPQALVAAVTLMVPLIPCLCGTRRPRLSWLLVGAAAGIAFHIKYNAGAFCIAAVSVVLGSRFILGQRYPWIRLLIPAGSFLAPFLLMFPLLSEANCLAFAIIAGLSAAAAAIATIAPSNTTPDMAFRPAAGAFFAGFAVVTTLALAFAQYHGANALEFLSASLSYAANQISFYHYFRPYSPIQLGLACLSLTLAASVVLTADSAAGRRITIPGKAGFALAALYALAINDAANAQAMLGYAGPWCWLAAVGRRGEAASDGRLLLAATAAWAPLIAYPMPGSQLYFGSLPILIAAIVCAADTIDLADAYAWRKQSLATAISCAALLAALGSLWSRHDDARRHYEQYEPLALPGTEFLRMEPGRAAIYRQLVDAVSPADLVLTTFRFNSLYIWSGGTTPSPVYFSQWPLSYSSPDEQERIKAGLQEARAPIVVTRPSPADGRPKSGILAWIDVSFEPYRTIGPYTLMKRRSAPAATNKQ